MTVSIYAVYVIAKIEKHPDGRSDGIKNRHPRGAISYRILANDILGRLYHICLTFEEHYPRFAVIRLAHVKSVNKKHETSRALQLVRVTFELFSIGRQYIMQATRRCQHAIHDRLRGVNILYRLPGRRSVVARDVWREHVLYQIPRFRTARFHVITGVLRNE